MFHIPNSFTKVSSSLKDFQFELIYVLKKKNKKTEIAGRCSKLTTVLHTNLEVMRIYLFFKIFSNEARHFSFLGFV